MNQSKSNILPFILLPAPQKKIATIRKFSWLDHAERHFKEGTIYSRRANDYAFIDPVKETLMYQSIMAYLGMFD